VFRKQQPLAAARFTEIIEREGRGGSNAAAPARNGVQVRIGAGIVWRIRRNPG